MARITVHYTGVRTHHRVLSFGPEIELPDAAHIKSGERRCLLSTRRRTTRSSQRLSVRSRLSRLPASSTSPQHSLPSTSSHSTAQGLPVPPQLHSMCWPRVAKICLQKRQDDVMDSPGDISACPRTLLDEVLRDLTAGILHNGDHLSLGTSGTILVCAPMLGDTYLVGARKHPVSIDTIQLEARLCQAEARIDASHGAPWRHLDDHCFLGGHQEMGPAKVAATRLEKTSGEPKTW